jgi:hypothetical protein
MCALLLPLAKPVIGHLDALHAALAELLLLPEARSALQSGSATAACLLDGFLRLADAHGAFQETAVELRACAAEAQAALRRRDDARLGSAVRSLRRAEKDLARLASSVLAAVKLPATLSTSDSAAEVEVSGALAEAVAAAACASAAVITAAESVSSAATTHECAGIQENHDIFVDVYRQERQARRLR